MAPSTAAHTMTQVTQQQTVDGRIIDNLAGTMTLTPMGLQRTANFAIPSPYWIASTADGLCAGGVCPSYESASALQVIHAIFEKVFEFEFSRGSIHLVMAYEPVGAASPGIQHPGPFDQWLDEYSEANDTYTACRSFFQQLRLLPMGKVTYTLTWAPTDEDDYVYESVPELGFCPIIRNLAVGTVVEAQQAVVDNLFTYVTTKEDGNRLSVTSYGVRQRLA
ncbi:hypothetical protein PoMZ_02842 [Pyricularia oryzae]|uniref:Uncharacterized protein n=1 Tax=Pyricularia oryzae TaxID=318829 RepID=A0A4V1C5X5_PYROR|nr:hypothetical protein PoMZ_02842 [Pyricularia oryzae]